MNTDQLEDSKKYSWTQFLYFLEKYFLLLKMQLKSESHIAWLWISVGWNVLDSEEMEEVNVLW